MSRLIEPKAGRPDDAELFSLYHVQCCFCGKILAVNVPQRSLSENVLVRCGHCESLLTVDMRARHSEMELPVVSYALHVGGPAQQTARTVSAQYSEQIPVGTTVATETTDMPTHTIIPPSHKRNDMASERPGPESNRAGKRSRNPSAYNIFIREEIQRIKARNPNIDHKQAFSTAAKNWASCPQLCLGLEEVESTHKTDMPEEDEAQSSRN